MSTNNPKNLHLSNVVAELSKKTTEIQPDTSQQTYRTNSAKINQRAPTADSDIKNKQFKIAPLIPEEPIARNPREQHQQDKSKQAFAQQGQENKKSFPIGQFSIIVLLIAVLGAIGFATYWIDTRINSLEVLAAQPAQTIIATPDNTPIDNDQIKQLTTDIAKLEIQLSKMTETMANDRKVLLSQLSNLEATIEQSNTEEAQAVKSEASTPATVPVKPSTPTTNVKSWFVNLGTYYSEDAALPLVNRIKQQGLSPKITMANIGGKPGYRIQLVGIENRKEAEQIAESLETRLNLNGLWVGRN